MKQLLDQPLHFLWAFLALTPLCLLGASWISGALSGLLLALPRELVDQWPISRHSDFLLDLAFFTLGGAFAGAFLG